MPIVADIVRRNGRLRSSKPALIDRERRLTWGQLDRQSNRFAHALHAKGLRKGERIAVLSGNNALLCVVQCALVKLGLVMVPLNYLLRRPELLQIAEEIEASAFLHDDSFAEMARDVGTAAVGPDRIHSIASLEREAAGCSDTDLRIDVSEDDPYSIIYTSGSTSRPKGVIRTNRMGYLNGLIGSYERRFDEDDVSVIYTPNFHVSFWDSQLHIAAMGGGTLIIMSGFDPGEYLDWVRTEGVTTFYGIYTTLKKLMEYPGFDGADLSSIRRVVLPFKISEPEQLKQIADRFGVPLSGLYTGWGMSETGPLVVNINGEGWAARPGTTGCDIPMSETRVVNEAGQVVPPGEVGVIEVRGPAIFNGYWKRPDENAKAFRDGWFRTGDAAYRDEDNYLYFFSRARDVIKRGGENISAQEVEDYLMTSPDIEEAAVIGVPDPHWEETVMAFVVASAGAKLTQADVIIFAKKGLPTYKVPQYVLVLDELPKVSVGKVAKHVLRDKYVKADGVKRFEFLDVVQE